MMKWIQFSASSLLLFQVNSGVQGLGTRFPEAVASSVKRATSRIYAVSSATNNDILQNQTQFTSYPSNDEDLVAAEARIADFLESNRSKRGKKNSDEDDERFYVQGWKWHTMSVIREAGRLQQLARKFELMMEQQQAARASCDDSSLSSLEEEDLLSSSLKLASDYVVGFNMKGLHKVEKKLFFPWVRLKLEELGGCESEEVVDAFRSVMDQLESDQTTMEKFGASLNRETLLATNPLATESTRLEAARSVVYQSAAIADCGRAMLQRENSLIIPAIARLVPQREQKMFNDKVIRTLGILDSRLHLVGMHEAVWELNDGRERQFFQEDIPSIPQLMIQRWKRLLYEPNWRPASGQ